MASASSDPQVQSSSEHDGSKVSEGGRPTNTELPPDPNSYLTLTGTIKRSKKSGRKDTDVEVKIKKEDLISIELETESVDDPN